METTHDLLLNVWREACRHIDIGQSTASIAALLARHLPIEQVLVCRIAPARGCLETVALGLPVVAARLPEARTACTTAEMKSLMAWCRRKEVVHRQDGREAAAPWSKRIFARLDGDVLAVPLFHSDEHCGALVLAASRGCAFGRKHIELAQQLMEPFAAALENDRRLRETAALGAAAEADKRALLNRLGRKALGEVIVGADSGLRAVMERGELVARSDAPVLIFGETGTGKELVARAIHNRSARHDGPFDRVNCGAIPPELIDSQLFGHERGAFTGAVDGRRGWFERADGGTLFLDEIGELPPAAQVRMLRILQDGWMERVGGEKPVHVDVRIIAATHRDLAAMVAEGRFREDLWYRIAVFPIVLPPLRERREDIARLASHFAQRAATRFGLAPAAPTPEDLALLSAYHWPGNVRELGAVIDRAAILGDGRRLDVATALGANVETGYNSTTELALRNRNAPADHPPDRQFESLDDALRRHIAAALRLARGRIEGRRGAAALLKINPPPLRAKMRQLGIDWSQYRETM